MRTAKSSMKHFFTAILCFLMNLIPGKKLMALVNAAFSANTDKNLISNRVLGQAANENEGCLMSGNFEFCNVDNRKYLSEYIEYLYEYVDLLAINKYRIKGRRNKVSDEFYRDTG